MTPPPSEFSRREMMKLLVGMGAACSLSPPGVSLADTADASQSKTLPKAIETRISRFMMKGDFPRLEVIGPGYRFIWHGRFFGFRLISTATDAYDERISYTNFGPFAVGGVDLICNHYEPFALTFQDGKPFRLGGGRLYAQKAPTAQGQVPESLMVEHMDSQRRALRVRLGFCPDAPLILVRFEPNGFERDSTLLLSWATNFIYDNAWQGPSSAAYYSRGAQTGLHVHSDVPGAVTVGEAPSGKLITCRIPADAPSELTLEVLGRRESLKPIRFLPGRSVSPGCRRTGPWRFPS